jgi:hypothetical protein
MSGCDIALCIIFHPSASVILLAGSTRPTSSISATPRCNPANVPWIAPEIIRGGADGHCAY